MPSSRESSQPWDQTSFTSFTLVGGLFTISANREAPRPHYQPIKSKSLRVGTRHELLVVVQLLSCFQVFVTRQITACQASLSFTLSQSLLKLMSVELTMPIIQSCLTLCDFTLLYFTFCHKGGVICISQVIDISPSNLDSSLCLWNSFLSNFLGKYENMIKFF